MWWTDFDKDEFWNKWANFMPRLGLVVGPEGKKGELATYRNPVTDLYETKDKVIATMEMPGINKEDIELNVTEDQIEVKVEKKAEKEEKEKGYYKYESMSRSFYRSLPLPVGVVADKAEASYKDGVLKIEVPKKEVKETKKKKISVK